MSRWPVIGLALLAVVTAGCAVQVSGTPKAAPSSAPPLAGKDRIHADDALGDLTSFNPCSVIVPEDLPKEWNLETYVPVAYEYCGVQVIDGDGTRGEVQVGYLYRSTHDLEKHEDGKRQGGITIVPDGTEDGSCTFDVVFADGIALVVRALPEDPEDIEAMCDVAEVVAYQVVEAAVAGRAENLDLPADSLGALDPCEVVTGDMIALVPGIAATVDAEPQVHRHSCWWESTTDGTMLNVDFNIGYMPEGDTGQTVHDRYTAITRYADGTDYSLCGVDGEHVPFEYRSESELMERVAIWVYLKPGQVEQACTVASTIADQLWPTLPPL